MNRDILAKAWWSLDKCSRGHLMRIIAGTAYNKRCRACAHAWARALREACGL